MTKERLGKYIQEYSVKNKTDLGYPVYSVTNSKGFCTEYFNKDVSGADKTTYKIVPRGFFAYNPSRINVGSIDWQNCEDNVIVSPLYVVFKCSDGLNQDYLKYYLKSDCGKRQINARVSGAVRNNLKFSVLSNFELEIGSIENQQTAVKLLKKIEDALNHEIEQLRLCEELVKSQYIEMFESGQSFPRQSLVELCLDSDDIKCGPFGTQLKQSEYRSEGVAVWGIPQINTAFESKPDVFVTEEKAASLESYSIQSGDIAVSRKGNVGKCAVFPTGFDKGIIASDVVRIRLNKDLVHPVFMQYQLHNSFMVKKQILDVSSGAIMAGINVTKLKNIKVCVPQLSLQKDFLLVVEQSDKLRKESQKRINLYKELLSKKTDELFNGESA